MNEVVFWGGQVQRHTHSGRWTSPGLGVTLRLLALRDFLKQASWVQLLRSPSLALAQVLAITIEMFMVAEPLLMAAWSPETATRMTLSIAQLALTGSTLTIASMHHSLLISLWLIAARRRYSFPQLTETGAPCPPCPLTSFRVDSRSSHHLLHPCREYICAGVRRQSRT